MVLALDILILDGFLKWLCLYNRETCFRLLSLLRGECRWVPPHLVTERLWGLSLLGIVSVKVSVAHAHGMEARTLGTWTAAVDLDALFVSYF